MPKTREKPFDIEDKTSVSVCLRLPSSIMAAVEAMRDYDHCTQTRSGLVAQCVLSVWRGHPANPDRKHIPAAYQGSRR